MTPQDRLAYALLAADDLDPGFANDLAIDDDAAPEMARILTIADEWLSQDLADGQALRLLREAIPNGAWTLRLHHWRDKSFAVYVDSMRETFEGRSQTIAAAADACRKALEARL